MRAGKLRERASLQRQVRAESVSHPGEKVDSWDTVTVLNFEDASQYGSTGREMLEQKRLNAKISRALRIRYRADVLPGMRFLTNTGVLRIVSVYDPDQRRASLVALCEEIPARG